MKRYLALSLLAALLLVMTPSTAAADYPGRSFFTLVHEAPVGDVALLVSDGTTYFSHERLAEGAEVQAWLTFGDWTVSLRDADDMTLLVERSVRIVQGFDTNSRTILDATTGQLDLAVSDDRSPYLEHDDTVSACETFTIDGGNFTPDSDLVVVLGSGTDAAREEVRTLEDGTFAQEVHLTVPADLTGYQLLSVQSPGGWEVEWSAVQVEGSVCGTADEQFAFSHHAPVGDVAIALTGGPGGAEFRAERIAEGEFVITTLPDGDYVLTLWDADEPGGEPLLSMPVGLAPDRNTFATSYLDTDGALAVDIAAVPPTTDPPFLSHNPTTVPGQTFAVGGGNFPPGLDLVVTFGVGGDAVDMPVRTTATGGFAQELHVTVPAGFAGMQPLIARSPDGGTIYATSSIEVLVAPGLHIEHPPSVRAGRAFVLRGYDFPPGLEVLVTLGSGEDAVSEPATVRRNGTFRVLIRVPGSFAPEPGSSVSHPLVVGSPDGEATYSPSSITVFRPALTPATAR